MDLAAIKPTPPTPPMLAVAASIDVQLALTQQATDVSPVLYRYLVEFLENCEDVESLVQMLSDIAQCGAIISRSHTKFEQLLAILFMFDWNVSDPRAFFILL